MQADVVLPNLHVHKVLVLQTLYGPLGAPGPAADGGSMASLFAQVQQLHTAVTALTFQPLHLVSLADCIGLWTADLQPCCGPQSVLFNMEQPVCAAWLPHSAD